MIVAHLNNNQSKKKAWMREDQWMWYLIHTDPFAITKPVFEKLELKVAAQFGIPLGCDSSASQPNGPPV
jgi:hypothetical protein|tara:strand:+ start:2559 stop:2765 length:207 start_codon:yes stop_codon:yes gene_type:complete